MTEKPMLLQQIATLNRKPTSDLKELWQRLFNASPPAYDKRFLVKRLAYRLQELAYGGLSNNAEQRLQALVKNGSATPPSQRPESQANKPLPGTRLLREWKGVEHCVTALADGFEYQGGHYRSLSAIARAITGTRWSGPAFFGTKRSGR